MTQFIDAYQMRKQPDALAAFKKEIKHWQTVAKQQDLIALSNMFETVSYLVESLTDDAARLDKLQEMAIIKTEDIRAWIDQQKDPDK